MTYSREEIEQMFQEARAAVLLAEQKVAQLIAAKQD